jgi:alpha-L-fucosidase
MPMKTGAVRKLLVLLALCSPLMALADGPYAPDWESLKAHKDPEWFRDAKLGIYTHWGPVTVGCEDSPKGGQWYGHEMYKTDNPVFAYHKAKYGDQKTFGYKDMIPLFTAEKFDPEHWADLFAKAGAKFAGPVAVHHDNFAMWDSGVTPWNSMKMGPKRDITGELAKAYRARGMKFLPTFHHGFAWRYFEPAFAYDAVDPKYKLLYTEPHEPKAPPSQRFLDQWLDMVMEVCRKYEPDMLWFDFELGSVITPDYQKKMFADYYNWAASRGKESAVAHKHREIHQHTGVLDFERGREDKLTPYIWLTDTALGPWFNQKSHAYRTTDNLVDTLVDIVSKNGCMLLNVGPQADGAIPAEAEKMLLELGDWMKVNGEAIYATRPWLSYGEGPTRSRGGGFSEGKDQPFTARDLRFTQSKDGKTIFVIALDWPDAPFSVESMKVAAAAPDARIELIGSQAAVTWRKVEAGKLVIEPPSLAAGQRPCSHAYAFKLTGFDLSLGDQASAGEPAAELTAKQAVLEGARLKLQDVGGENIGFWDNPAERVHWLVYLPDPGAYVASLRCSSAYQANAMKLEVAGKAVEFNVPQTANWTAIQSVRAGEFKVDAPGVFHVILQSATPELWKAVNVFCLELARKP